MGGAITRVLVAAAAALLPVTSGCGLGDAVDKAGVCSEATKAFNDAGAKMSAAATSPDSFNHATKELSDKLKNLAGKAGDNAKLKAALMDMSTAWANVKIDPNNPGSVVESVNKLQQQPQQIAEACK